MLSAEQLELIDTNVLIDAAINHKPPIFSPQQLLVLRGIPFPPRPNAIMHMLYIMPNSSSGPPGPSSGLCYSKAAAAAMAAASAPKPGAIMADPPSAPPEAADFEAMAAYSAAHLAASSAPVASPKADPTSVPKAVAEIHQAEVPQAEVTKKAATVAVSEADAPTQAWAGLLRRGEKRPATYY
jgi:hypothetical protein